MRTELQAQASEAGRQKVPGPAAARRNCMPVLSCQPGRQINHILTLLWCDFLFPASNTALYGAVINEKSQHRDTILPDEPGSGHPKITEALGPRVLLPSSSLGRPSSQGRPHTVVRIPTSGNKSGALMRRLSPSPREGLRHSEWRCWGPTSCVGGGGGQSCKHQGWA